MGKFITILGGIISILLGICGMRTWWWDFVSLLKGCVPPVLVLGGLAAVFAAISEIRDSMQAKKQEAKAKEEKK